MTVRQLRRERTAQQALQVRERTAKVDQRLAALLQANKECEQKLLDALEVTVPTRRRVKDSTLKDFAKLLKGQLVAFIHVRKYKDMNSDKWPNKGTLTEAETGVENLIKIAFDVRARPLLLEKNIATESGNAIATDQSPTQQMPTFATVDVLRNSIDVVNDRSFVITDDWLTKVKDAFDSSDCCLEVCSDVPKLQVRADLLFRILWTRLDQHVKDRVPPTKHEHWVFDFVRMNLSRMAAVMVYFDHIQDDLECLVGRSNKCLLRNASNNFIPLKNGTPAAKELEGCYLYYDTTGGDWIRSGKVIGRPFQVRHKEHQKHSLLKESTSSRFYTTFPSRDATLDTQHTRQGYFENLEIYCGVGISRKEPGLSYLKDTGPESVFVCNDNYLRYVNMVSFRGVVDPTEKQMHMIGYLCELAYDLAIAPANNVSESPGFEGPLGIFGGASTK